MHKYTNYTLKIQLNYFPLNFTSAGPVIINLLIQFVIVTDLNFCEL